MNRLTLSPEEARQGRIVLTGPARRIVFFGGLIALTALAALAALI